MDACPSNATIIDNCQDDSCRENSDTCHDTNWDNARMVNRSPASSSGGTTEPISRELRRFQLLIAACKEKGISQAELARRTGIDATHINRLANAEKYGYTGLSAEIVRKVRDAKITSSEYFFDDTERSPFDNIYSLDEKREKVWRASVEEQLYEFTKWKHEQSASMLELRAVVERKDAEIARLKQELSQAQSSKKRPTK